MTFHKFFPGQGKSDVANEEHHVNYHWTDWPNH